MRDLFNLTVPEGRKREDIDAHLHIASLDIPFELKSTTTGSIATVRDFGMPHLDKWRREGWHWLFGFYGKDAHDPKYFIYCPPDVMERWYSQMQSYIWPDVLLSRFLPSQVNPDLVKRLLKSDPPYSLKQAKSIMKQQWSADQYRKARDLGNGYSINSMTHILRLRAKYVIERGSTLNNPHIPSSFFAGMPHIKKDDEPAAILRQMVMDYLRRSRTDTAALYATGGQTELPI